MNKRLLTVILSLSLTAVLFAGCNTLRGVGQDTKNAARDAADTVKNAADKTGDVIKDTTSNTRNGVKRDLNNRTSGRYGTAGMERLSSKSGRVTTHTTRLRDFFTNGSNRAIDTSHLSGLLGMSTLQADSIFGANSLGGHARNIFGSDAKINFEYDTKGRVEKVIVNVDKENLARWKSELSRNYGHTVGTNNWINNGEVVTVHEHGDYAQIVITKVV